MDDDYAAYGIAAMGLGRSLPPEGWRVRCGSAGQDAGYAARRPQAVTIGPPMMIRGRSASPASAVDVRLAGSRGVNLITHALDAQPGAGPGLATSALSAAAADVSDLCSAVVGGLRQHSAS